MKQEAFSFSLFKLSVATYHTEYSGKTLFFLTFNTKTFNCTNVNHSM